MQLFAREKSIQVDQADDGTLEVTAHFKDKFHEINTFMVFDCNSKEILKAEAKMITVPFDLCHEVCGKMSGLTGLQGTKGINKWVKEIIGGARGCAHLVDMVMDSVKALTQATGFCLLPEDLSFDEKLQKIQEVNMGICHTYSNLGRRPKYIGNRDI